MFNHWIDDGHVTQCIALLEETREYLNGLQTRNESEELIISIDSHGNMEIKKQN